SWTQHTLFLCLVLWRGYQRCSVMHEYNFGDLTFDHHDLLPSSTRQLMGYGKPHSLPPGACLYSQGDPADACFFLADGVIKSTTVSIDGHESLLRIHLAGGILGLTALREGGTRDATAIAMDHSELISISRSDMLMLMEKNASLGIHISRLLVYRMCSLHYRLNTYVFNNIEQRIAHVLVTLTRQRADGRCFYETGVGLSHEEIAQI